MSVNFQAEFLFKKILSNYDGGGAPATRAWNSWSFIDNSVSFFPIRSWTSKYLATHLSIQTDSPFWRSASWYRGGMHFLWQADDSLEYMSVIISISKSWTSFIFSSSIPARPAWGCCCCAILYWKWKVYDLILMASKALSIPFRSRFGLFDDLILNFKTGFHKIFSLFCCVAFHKGKCSHANHDQGCPEKSRNPN